jgi:N-acetylneuraminate synthase
LGEEFSKDNIWVKRPGTGEILAADFPRVLGRTATRSIKVNAQLTWDDISL